MQKERISYRETARQFEISDDKRVAVWERIYLEEGAEGLAIERRGRRRGGQLAKLPKEVEEDLIAENQRLRAENEYLKNLQALVLEDERRQRKKTLAVQKLRQRHSLEILLSTAQTAPRDLLLSSETNE